MILLCIGRNEEKKSIRLAKSVEGMRELVYDGTIEKGNTDAKNELNEQKMKLKLYGGSSRSPRQWQSQS